MTKREGIPFNGFHSVIEMLRHSDPAFREHLLNNIRRRDPVLAHRLDAELRTRYSQETIDSRAALDRSQRMALTRTYGH